jgi:hypothetical protein
MRAIGAGGNIEIGIPRLPVPRALWPPAAVADQRFLRVDDCFGLASSSWR